jgi:polyvinyl alcohol dehydrogenase (cytochrome)
MRLSSVVAAAGAALVVWTTAAAQPPVDTEGQALFKARCASCHDPALDRAPSREQLGQRWPDEIARSLKNGVMAPMATGLSEAQIASIANYLTGGRPSGSVGFTQVDPPKCPVGGRFTMAGKNWNGWGTDFRNHRFQANGGLKAADVPRLKVKWAFTYIGARYSQPVVVGGRLFMTSGNGTVYAFDARTGCYHWRFNAGAGVRTTPVVGANSKARSGYAIYFGDYQRNYYALDAADGTLIWKSNVEAHPRGVLSGSPLLWKGRLIVPVSSWEEVTGPTAPYPCCSARGSVASLDVATGKILWKTYMIEEEPRPIRRNAAGTQMFGPAGAAVWSTPTIDPKRNLIYVGTGNSYTEIPSSSTDAIVALDFDSGAIRWKNQVTPNDNYNMGCYGPRPGVNCPLGEQGPDHDFGASPVLVTLPGGKDVLLAGQKSGVVYGMDPDAKGKVVWQTKIGQGGALGGIEFGMATDGKIAYVANADAVGNSPDRRPGLYAMEPATGKVLWATPSPKVACGWVGGSRCVNGNSAAPVMIPGAVIAGTIDGHMRGYDPKTGRIVWDFDSAGQKYQTINGTKDQGGGAVDAGGAVVAEGMLFMMSGYIANMGGYPNNVLLALSVDGK